MPENSKFGPLDITVDNESIINMTVEEYEVIRLIDVEGMTQEECSKQMAISRTTVQGIYNDARKKLADSLVNGKALFIDGGDYLLCDGKGGMCGRGCRRRQFQQNIDNEGEEK